MNIYNENKTQIITEYDLSKGYLKNDFIKEIIPEVKAVKEVYHYETIKEYPNGGKEVKKIIDIAGAPYQPEKVVETPILVYVKYTQQELNKIRITELKRKLIETDYKAIKYAEGQISEEDYAPIKAERQSWRDEINELENYLKV